MQEEKVWEDVKDASALDIPGVYVQIEKHGDYFDSITLNYEKAGQERTIKILASQYGNSLLVKQPKGSKKVERFVVKGTILPGVPIDRQVFEEEREAEKFIASAAKARGLECAEPSAREDEGFRLAIERIELTEREVERIETRKKQDCCSLI